MRFLEVNSFSFILLDITYLMDIINTESTKIDVIVIITGHIPCREYFVTYDRMIHLIKAIYQTTVSNPFYFVKNLFKFTLYILG